MKLLIHGTQTQSGQALIRRLQTQNLEFSAPDDLPDPEELVDLIRASNATQVFNLAFEPRFSLSWGKADPESAVSQQACDDALRITGLLATACRSLDLPLIHLSSALVFDGLKSQAYQEGDEQHPVGATAKAVLTAEQVVSESCSRYAVVRTEMVFSPATMEPFVDCIRRAREADGKLDVPALRFSPTPADDVARVLLAIAFQVDCDAEPWGVFHYAALQGISQARFVEEFIKAAASRDPSLGDAVTDLEIVAGKPKQGKGRNIVLNCGKIMATFGIKQRPRKAGIDEVLDRLYPVG